MSATFRAYNYWDGIEELERAARLGLSGAMNTEYPLENQLRPTRVRAVLPARRL